MTETEHHTQADGRRLFAEDRAQMLADPEMQAVYVEEAARKELWLQLVAAREAAGLTQAAVAKRLGVSRAQVARLEKSGYDAYTLTSLRRYIHALGEDFELIATVRHRLPNTAAAATAAKSRSAENA